MQGIRSTQHQELLRVLKKFEDLVPTFGSIIPCDREEFIRDKAAELKGQYDYYQLLLKELQDCIHTYEHSHDVLRKVMYPYLRKMQTKSKR